MSHVEPWTFLSAWAVAFGASIHCVGMCGGFAVAATVSPGAPKGVGRWVLGQLLYHLGKTTTYAFLGALATVFGLGAARWGSGAYATLSAVAGALLVLVGAWQLGIRLPVWPVLMRAQGRIVAAWNALGWGRAVYRSTSAMRPLYLGMLSGCLPCPLVWAFLASAAAQRSFLGGVSILVALGLGTVPALLLTALTGAGIRPAARGHLLRVGGALLVLLGCWTWYRGWTELSCCAHSPL